MINYYYEIKDGVRVFGHDQKYLAQFDVSPRHTNNWRPIHDQACRHSTRIWMENANGVTLVKGPITDTSWGQVNEQELVWLKLICRDIETL
jgi:hypothetical protein